MNNSIRLQLRPLLFSRINLYNVRRMLESQCQIYHSDSVTLFCNFILHYLSLLMAA
jgi:hypothetical protein